MVPEELKKETEQTEQTEQTEEQKKIENEIKEKEAKGIDEKIEAKQIEPTYSKDPHKFNDSDKKLLKKEVWQLYQDILQGEYFEKDKIAGTKDFLEKVQEIKENEYIKNGIKVDSKNLKKEADKGFRNFNEKDLKQLSYIFSIASV